MSVESTRETVMRFFNAEHSDTSMMADDVVFTVMDTGEEFRGPEAILGMLDRFYHEVFEAIPERRSLIVADGQVAAEFDFAGTHRGEFAGVPATGKQVHVPLCVIYDIEGDKIKRGRVYFETPAFLAQVGALP